VKLHIVIAFPYALGTPGGGSEDCLQTARHLRRAGMDVTLITVTSHTASRFPRPETTGDLIGREKELSLQEQGVEVIRVAQNPWHYFLDGIGVRKSIVALHQKKKIDFVVGWHQEAAFLPKKLKSLGIKLVMIATNGKYQEWRYASHGLRRFFRDLTVARPLQKADLIFARSEFMKKLVQDVFQIEPGKIEVAYCGVSADFFEVGQSVGGHGDKLLFYGWWRKEKGVFDLIAALGELAQRGRKDWFLKVAGWGDAEAALAKAKACNIGENIELLGKLSHQQLHKEMQWADVVILPSHAESFGLAVAEAQAAALPVIAYDVGAVPEIVQHEETGLLVPLHNIEALTDTIDFALSNPEKLYQMGLQGRQHCEENFSWTKTANTMVAKLNMFSSQL